MWKSKKEKKKKSSSGKENNLSQNKDNLCSVYNDWAYFG